MFRPNTFAQLKRKGTKRDIFGKETFLPAVTIPCSIVRLSTEAEQSSVRADSSASRGSAEDNVAQAVILVMPSCPVVTGDVISKIGIDIEVTGKHPRIDTSGRLDHFEITGKIRSEI